MGIESNILKHASKIRGNLVRLSHMQKIPHLASSLSCVDILTAAYFGDVLNISSSNVTEKSRDRFILSKGHAGASLYATLFEKGILEEKTFWSTSEFKSPLAEQPAPYCAPGVEWATGSLGHGLSAGIGMCLASKIHGNPFKVMVLMGDGECNEGSVWEAVNLAAYHELDNLCCIVDYNGSADRALTTHLAGVFSAFGWVVNEISGHNMYDIHYAINEESIPPKLPYCLIAVTTKGHGVSFMENNHEWHHKAMNQKQYRQAIEEF